MASAIGSLKFMGTSWVSSILTPRTVVLLAVLGFCRPGMAQQVSFALLPPPKAVEPSPMVRPVQQKPISFETGDKHHFWDRENTCLFATSVAFSAGDFVVTRDNLRGGGQELNPVVNLFGHSSTGLAVNFASENLGMIGLSYFFHKTGHHKMERAVSMVNIGGSASAVGFGLAHR
jgi:hypothetical protein